MIPTSFSDLAAATGSRLVAGDLARTFTGVSTDTRTLKPGDLYFSLSGPNFDGNAFTGAAIEGGAAGALVRGGDGAPPFDRDAAPGTPTSSGASPFSGAPPSTSAPGSPPILAHPDPRRALADFATWHRARLGATRVVGVTGSCGKTTTKNVLLELLRAAVRDEGAAGDAVVGSPNSFNNDIGVPHTLFMAGHGTEVCVVEMGTNHPGEIEGLCRIARPSGGIVTNVGAAHLEGLRSIEGVAREKGSLVESLPADGFCVLNADSPFTPAMRERTAARVITFSVDGDGDLDARDVWFHAAGTTFRLGDREVTSPLLGLHNVQNLLAALAACRGLGLDLDRCLSGVSRLVPSHRRLERRRLGETVLIDDSYNANPESARASVRVLAGLHGHARRVLVLGDMHELGESAGELHYEVGRDAARAGVDLLITVGELGVATAAGAIDGGLGVDEVVHFVELDSALAGVPGLVRAGDVVLVKGSRRAGLERLVERLVEVHREDAA